MYATVEVVLCRAIHERLFGAWCADVDGSARLPETLTVDALFVQNGADYTISVQTDRITLFATIVTTPGYVTTGYE